MHHHDPFRVGNRFRPNEIYEEANALSVSPESIPDPPSQQAILKIDAVVAFVAN
jgi:hypothetical protein